MKGGRTILTLDAGGTNFVFSALRDFREVTDDITMPACADNLEKSLENMIRGFRMVRDQAGRVDALSFAFPGPADYTQGIIGDLPNFPAFTAPVPLADILSLEFKVPVFINNDANLFAAGEALSGYLPALNSRLNEQGSHKKFRNLIGITLGTGFGCGIVAAGQLIAGDNSSGAEIHNTLNKFNPTWNAEENVSARAVIREYAQESGVEEGGLTPEVIYRIAKGDVAGDRKAAITSFRLFGRALGASLVNVLTLADGIVVMGGGLTGAWDLFSGPMFDEINTENLDARGEKHPRLSFRVFNLEDPASFSAFVQGTPVSIAVPGSDAKRVYDAMPRTGVGLSSLGVSRATSLGAYSFAINKLNQL